MLKKFNFGKDIWDWVNPLFKAREGRILLGGHLTDKILSEQGIPQDDIISAFIFIIEVEILLIKITKSKNIKSVQMDGEECKAQTLTIAREEESLKNCIIYVE